MTQSEREPLWQQIIKNAFRFVFNVGYSMIFPVFFGMENVLPSVAMCVGLTMLPFADLNVNPLTMAGTIVLLNLGCGLAAQSALAPIWLALPINLIFVALLLLLTCEPKLTKPSISFLLCFVFCQSNPVPLERLPMRMLGLFVGSMLTAVTLLVVWRHRGYGKNGRHVVAQVRHCMQHKSYILRMAIGLSAAMFIGMALHLKRPLWISIVVMSLTQMEVDQTLERIKLRTIGTVIGIILFIVVFGFIIPPQYAMLAVLAMGYLSFFTSDYKHKTVVNAISAINASLALLDTGSAIENRVACLAAGIGIVLVMWVVQHGYGHFHRQYLARKSAA